MTKKLALLDMSQGFQSRGVPSLKRLGERRGYQVDLFDVRIEEKLPRLQDYDVFISSGGPGEPNLKGKGEEQAVELYRSIDHHNSSSEQQKQLLTICHSHQLLCMAFGLGTLVERPEGRLLGPHPQTKHPLAPYDIGITYGMESRFYGISDGFTENSKDLKFVPLLLGVDKALTAVASCDSKMLSVQFHLEAEPDEADAMFDDPEASAMFAKLNPGMDLKVMRARTPDLQVPYRLLEKFLQS